MASTVVALGRVYATESVLAAVSLEELQRCIARHQVGDWGAVEPEDQVANDRAVREGSRILSAYDCSHGVRIWIITEADRSSTTLLLPKEY
ncbi:MAG TPA: hypothetical protein PKA27_13700 [Fimbriimonadaceae bacterium]|nr:hypothetical protein [Fimbriimonadaceae bacterium]